MDNSKEIKKDWLDDISDDEFYEDETHWNRIKWKLRILFYYKLKLFKIVDAYYDTKNGIKSLIRWFPVIWDDRDYDKTFIFNILIKKLEINRDGMLRRDRHTEVNKNVDEINHSIDLLKKVNNEWDNYDHPFFKKHDLKWGEKNIKLIKIEKEGDKNKGSYEMLFEREIELTPEQEEIERKEYNEGLEKMHKDRHKDMQEAFNNIVEFSDGWWD